MRTHIGAAALALVLGFGWKAAAAPIQLVTGNSSQATATTPSYFTPLSMSSFLISPSKFASYFPAMPSIANVNGYAATAPIPMTNNQPNAAYFQLFGLKTAPRAQ